MLTRALPAHEFQGVIAAAREAAGPPSPGRAKPSGSGVSPLPTSFIELQLSAEDGPPHPIWPTNPARRLAGMEALVTMPSYLPTLPAMIG